jgi:hypothetical protein
MRYGRAVVCAAVAGATLTLTPLGGVAQGASDVRVPASAPRVVTSQAAPAVVALPKRPAPRAYCTPLRAALRSSRAALFLSGSRQRRAQAVTEYRYRRAAQLSTKTQVAKAMSEAGNVYRALRAGDTPSASAASGRRFAAVPPAARTVWRECRVDLRRPVDYIFRIETAAG